MLLACLAVDITRKKWILELSMGYCCPNFRVTHNLHTSANVRVK